MFEEEICIICKSVSPVKNEQCTDEFWIQCDQCSGWIHGICSKMSNQVAQEIEYYKCAICRNEEFEENTKKVRRLKKRIDYKGLNDGVITIYRDIVDRIEEKKYPEKYVRRFENGSDLTKEKLLIPVDGHGFIAPCIIKHKEGLGMEVPNADIGVDDIAREIGYETPVSVVDVNSQENIKKWTMDDWVKYFESKNRDRILNVISLEVSFTEFGNKIKRPKLVDELDLITNLWPKSMQGGQETFPKVQKYCLMSPEGAYTDFHIDFSGTWVFYHLLRGKKVFYMVPPIHKNFTKFEKWSLSEMQYVMLFSETCKNSVSRIELNAGETMIIPAGWIHAVSTLMDSVVIGGNFMVLETMDIHINAFNLEKRLSISETYQLPHFVMICEWVLLHLSDVLKRSQTDEVKSDFTGTSYCLSLLQNKQNITHSLRNIINVLSNFCLKNLKKVDSIGKSAIDVKSQVGMEIIPQKRSSENFDQLSENPPGSDSNLPGQISIGTTKKLKVDLEVESTLQIKNGEISEKKQSVGDISSSKKKRAEVELYDDSCGLLLNRVNVLGAIKYLLTMV